jgi:hypothetical protein
MIIVVYTVIGGVGGAGAAFSLGKTSHGAEGKGLLAVGFLVGGVIGYFIGTERAFVLRLQAQIALCQVQIERNTRSSAHFAGEQQTSAVSSATGIADQGPTRWRGDGP